MPLDRFLAREEGGVSEVVGTILTLSITVVLFSSVFAAVTHLEPPEERDHVDFVSDYERHDGTVYINVTHQGGKKLDTFSLNFMVVVDDVSHRYQLDDSEVEITGEDDDEWSPGEDIRFKEDELTLGIGAKSTVEMLIQNENTNRVIYTTTLIEEGRGALQIRDAYPRYIHDWREYAEPGEEIELVADIFGANMMGGNFYVNASISDKGVLETLGGTSKKKFELTQSVGTIYNTTLKVRSEADIDRYTIKVTAENETVTADPEYMTLNVGEETVDLYQPDLVVGNMRYSPGSPTHGDDFTLRAEVYNNGRVNYTASWEVFDDGVSKGKGNTTFSPGPAPTIIKAPYQIMGDGSHNIKVKVGTELYLDENMTGGYEDDVNPKDNTRNKTIHVDPYVLIVRDSLGQEVREGLIMENALRSLNLDYGVLDVNADSDTPSKSYLSEYSVVVWMTGNQTDHEPYIGSATNEVNNYIEDEEGTLWLIGSNLNEVSNNNNWGNLKDKLGFDSLTDDNLASEKVLTTPTGDKDVTYGNETYMASPGGDYLSIDKKSAAEDKNTLEAKDGAATTTYGVGYEENPHERTAVNSFLFDNVMDPGERSVMTAEVIEWLSNVTTRSGRDVSVSTQRIDPTAPMFMDDITINATLRNNGPEDLFVSVRCVRNDGEEVLRPEGGRAIYLPKNGGTNTTTFTWLADELGTQKFVIRADYYDEIDEVNERNNDITYKDLEVTDDMIEVNVYYSTLVVDDDLSHQIGTNNVSAEVVSSFERLSHRKGRDFEYHQVDQYDDGPTFDTMSQYNAVIWVTGEVERSEDTILTDTDVNNILDYLKQDRGANMMFIGENLLEYLKPGQSWTPTGAKELLTYMGIDDNSINANSVSASKLIGQEGNDLSHALKYDVNAGSLDNFATTADGEVVFEQENGESLATIYDDGSAKVVYMGLNLGRFEKPLVDEKDYEDWPSGDVDIDFKSARDEFIYTSMWNFGKMDERAQLRVTDYDVEFSSDYPHTSRSYQIRAEIQNIGYQPASVLVRVKEGDNHIGSKSILVEGSERTSNGGTHFNVTAGNATAEITWRPAHAGKRDIRVRIDPLRTRDEIMYSGEKVMEFNNQAKVNQSVYYFWDDMEKSEKDWNHDHTVMNINGESPLDFVNRENVKTNVVGEWDKDYSGSTDEGTFYDSMNGTFETDNEEIDTYTHSASRSNPRSFWMPETEGGTKRKPIDMVIVLDYSGSMDEEEDDMEDAACAAVGMLTDQDRVAVFPFSYDPWNSDPWNDHIPFTYATESNKNTINSTIRSWSTGGSTALYDTSAMAGEYMMANGRGSNVVKGFIGMTDGASNSDEDDYTHAPDEDSSKDQYAYQNDWESQTVDWDNYDSPYTGDTLSVSNDNGEYGCLGMPWNTNAVGLGSSVDPDWKWIGWSGGDSEPGGAQTSKLNWYNHTNDPNELEKIFKNFVKSVKSEAGGLKSVNPGEITPQSSKDELTATTVWEDDFEDGDLSPWTESGSGGVAGVNTDTSNSGSYSMYTSGGEVMSTSPTIDLSGYSSAKVGYWVRKGDDSFSEDPDDGEDLYFEYLDDSGNWKQIDFFESSSISDGEIVDKTGSPVDLGSDALHATFQLRFRQTDGSSGWDYWHMDDITITGTSDSGGGGGGDDSTDPETYDIKRRDYRLLTTNPTEIRDAEDMTLSFWTKYWMTEGTNGGVVYLWGSDSGSWNWDRDHRIYLKPKQSYTGNLKFDAVKSEKNSGGPLNDNGLVDANGELPYWCFNGKSQSGTFDWRYTEIPLGDYLDDFSFDHVRIAFLYARMGGISEEEGWQPEMGWYVDDVNLKVTRDSTGTIPQNDKGYWMRVSKDELVNEKGFNSPSDPGKYYDNTYGNETGHYWMYTRNDAGEDSLPQGVDTSLYTSSIALTNADNPELRAYMKFNIDEAAGLPPDGLRIEVSDDNGRTWNSLTYGIRTGWGASGDSQHGNYSGETDDASNYGWVNSGTLARLNADLSGWRGENIILRFRVFTNLTDTYDDTTLPKAIFIDDVVVRERDMQTTLASKEEAISDEEVTSSLSRDDIDRGFYDTRTGIDPLNLEKGNKIDLRYNAPSAPRLKAGDMKTIRFSDEFRTERIKERRKRC